MGWFRRWRTRRRYRIAFARGIQLARQHVPSADPTLIHRFARTHALRELAAHEAGSQ